MRDDYSLLEYALLGLIHQQPRSGYDLRKVFSSTAMGSFSDSPGAIYPALSRLEARGLARGTVESSSGLRRRRVFRITPKGLAAFKAWLKSPVTHEDVTRGIDNLMLPFAFMDQALGPKYSVRFLRQFADRLEALIPRLQQFLRAHAPEMPVSARLALECGIQEYAMKLRWARASIATYERKEENKK